PCQRLALDTAPLSRGGHFGGPVSLSREGGAMARATMVLVRRTGWGAKNVGEPLLDLASGLALPAAVGVDGGRAAGRGAARVWGWLRVRAACALRAVADVLDPRPVPVPCHELGADPVPVAVPVPLPMPSAAQTTAAPARKRTAARVASPELRQW